MPEAQKPMPQRRELLRRTDQAVVGGCTLFAIVALVGYWVSHGMFSGELVEIDRAESNTARFTVDINQAGWPEFAQLPGVGETLARRIVDDRQRRGKFLDHADLRRVRGIGPKTLEQLRPYLRAMPAASDVAKDRQQDAVKGT